MSGRDSQCSVSRQDSLPPPTSLGDGGLRFTSPRMNDENLGSSMSMTWPRANLSLGGNPPPRMSSVPPILGNTLSGVGLSSVPLLSLKGPVQINADALLVADGEVLASSINGQFQSFMIFFIYTVQNSVKTSFSRPLSKPRVRNPLSSLKLPSQRCAISPNPSSIPSIGTSNNQMENSVKVEQDFLTSSGNSDNSPPQWADRSFDEEYFSIPEDNTLLNCSLSSSLSSLCNHKDLDGDVSPPLGRLSRPLC